MVAIVLSVFVGSGMLAIASSGSKPNGQPFQAIWDAIDYIESIWSTDGTNVWSGKPGYVGIGTDTPSKKLHVVGDAMFSNTANDSYFFIEAGQGEDEGDPIPVDGKRIGAYDEAGGTGWKTLGIDGNPLVLNARSSGKLQIHAPINLVPVSEPANPDEGFILYVVINDNKLELKAKSSAGDETILATSTIN